MSLNLNTSASPSGARRMSLDMLEARDRADGFRGAPAGTAKPLTYLAAFQEAEPYLALPAHAFKLVSWLVKQTMAQDWEAGSRPIAWPSARRQQEFLGLSPARVKMLNRALFEAGIFVIRDNEQGKRYGRRGADKRIIEAFGFDLSPLAQRHEEFIRIAAAARSERNRMRDLRRRITLARRAIRQSGEMLVASGTPHPQDWLQLMVDLGDLLAAARKAERSADLGGIADRVEALQKQAEHGVRQALKPVDTNPTGLENEPLSISTNLTSNPMDTVIASGESSCTEGGAQDTPAAHGRRPKLIGGMRRPSQFLELTPRLEAYLTTPEPTWSDVTDAASGPLRHELGVSVSLWGEACHVMGREVAALALAIVSTKPDSHFTRSADGYFGGMVRKAQKGELFLERTLWVLREAKWGKTSMRRPH